MGSFARERGYIKIANTHPPSTQLFCSFNSLTNFYTRILNNLQEVEKAVLLFQQRVVTAAFWEKDVVFQRDDPIHEVRKRKEKENISGRSSFSHLISLSFIYVGEIDFFVDSNLPRSPFNR